MGMTNHFTPSLSKTQWLSLPSLVRVKIVNLFQVPRSEGAHVQIGGPENTFGTSDGHSTKDLETITIEKLQDHLHSTETDFFQLFDALVRSIKGEIVYSDTGKTEKEIAIEKWITQIRNFKSESVLKDIEKEFYAVIGAFVKVHNIQEEKHEETTEVLDAPRRPGRPKKAQTAEAGGGTDQGVR